MIGPAGPIDTSALGPIRVDPDRTRQRAHVMREAIEAVAETAGRDGRIAVSAAFSTIALIAADEDLAQLQRMVRHFAPV